MTITTLASTDHGLYFVNTAHSAYLVDLDERFIVRTPAHDDAAQLRGDATKVTLLDILLCEVGYSARFAVTGIAEDGPTLRTTSPVVSIELAA